jgi:hypothetical protein
MLKQAAHILALGGLIWLSACGDSNDGEINVTVNGLSGDLVLEYNEDETLEISQDGSYSFDTTLEDGQSYDVRVATGPIDQGCDLDNARGTFEGSGSINITVTCDARAWNHPTTYFDTFADPLRDIGNQEVAMDDRGNKIVAWQQEDSDGDEQVYIAMYQNGTWTKPSNAEDYISLNPDSAVDDVALAMNGDGDAIVAWLQFDGSDEQVYISEYRNGSWTHPSSLTDDHISIDGQDAYEVEVAMDEDGNTLVVWNQYDGTEDQIYFSEYRDGTWTHPTSLTDDHISIDGENAYEGEVAMDDNGNAIIAWIQHDGTNDQVFIGEYRDGTWSFPSSLTDDHISIDGQDSYDVEVAMSNAGNAVVTWIQYDGSNDQAYRSKYRNGTWIHPTDLMTDHFSPAGEDVYNIELAMDNLGDAVITWEQYDGDHDQIYMSELRDGTWTNPTDLEDTISFAGTSAEDEPAVAMDDNGNAIIAWSQNLFSAGVVYISEYRNGSWVHPTFADFVGPLDKNGRDADDVAVAMSNNGEAIIAWEQDEPGDDYDVLFVSEYK